MACSFALLQSKVLDDDDDNDSISMGESPGGLRDESRHRFWIISENVKIFKMIILS